MKPKPSQNNIRKLLRILKIPNNTKTVTKESQRQYKRSQNNIKYHNIIPKITTFNIKPMIKEFKRITKMYQKNPKHYQIITQSINRQIIKNK